MVHLYTYYMYGDLDNTPDVINGVPQPSENFRDTKDCISLDFKNKNIDFEGQLLTKRDIFIIDKISEGIVDKAIADELNISMSTLDFHKKQLFSKLKASSKPQAVSQAFKTHILC